MAMVTGEMASEPQANWTLHPTLAQDGLVVGDMPLCRVLLTNDANYPWLVLVPRKPELIEIIDLDHPARQALMTEIALAAEALKRITACDKLNVAALGNTVAQLHVHVIARFRGDAAGPRPVWGQVPAKAYDDGDSQALIAALRLALGL